MKLFQWLVPAALALVLPCALGLPGSDLWADDPVVDELESLLQLLDGDCTIGGCSSVAVVKAFTMGPDGQLIEVDPGEIPSFDFGDFDCGDIDFGNIDFGNIDFGNIDFGNIAFGDIDLGDIEFGEFEFGDCDFESILNDLDIEALLSDLDLDGLCAGLADFDWEQLDGIDGNIQCHVSTHMIGPDGQVIEFEGDDLSDLDGVIGGMIGNLGGLLGDLGGVIGSCQASVNAVVVDGNGVVTELEDCDIAALLGDLQGLDASLQEFIAELLDD